MEESEYQKRSGWEEYTCRKETRWITFVLTLDDEYFLPLVGGPIMLTVENKSVLGKRRETGFSLVGREGARESGGDCVVYHVVKKLQHTSYLSEYICTWVLVFGGGKDN